MSIKAHEVHHGREYIVEEHRGNGIAVGALSTAIPAAAITLANFAKEWLGNKGRSCDSGSIAGLVAAIAPAIAAMRGTTDVNGNFTLTVPEAGHGLSYLVDPDGYLNALRAFFGPYL